jgi:hypothetical protein
LSRNSCTNAIRFFSTSNLLWAAMGWWGNEPHENPDHWHACSPTHRKGETERKERERFTYCYCYFIFGTNATKLH